MAETLLRKHSVQERLNKQASDVITVTATTLASATFAVHKVISQSIEIPFATSVPGGTSIIKSVAILDEGVTGLSGLGIDIYFSSSSANITEALNKPIGEDIADLDVVLRSMLGFVAFVKTEFIEFIDCDFAVKTGVDLMVQSASDSTSIYMHVVNRINSYTSQDVDDLIVKIGLIKD